MAWLAKYAGVCDNCGGGIEVGDQITFVAGMGDDRHVIHGYCSESTRRAPAEVCTTCWLEMPCGCEDGQ